MEWDQPKHIVRFLGPVRTRTCLQLIAFSPTILLSTAVFHNLFRENERSAAD